MKTTDVSKNTENKTAAKSQEKQTETKSSDNQNGRNQQRRTPNYRHKVNQQGRSTDLYQKNHRYDNRFANRHPYHYLATGPIN